MRHESLAPVAAIVGGDDQLVADLAELVLPEHQVAIAESHNRNGAVAHLLVLAQLRIDGRHAQAAAHQHHRPRQLANVAGQPQRSDEIENRVAFAQAHHLEGRLAHRLDHHGHGALLRVEIRHGQRNSLATLIDASHDEMPGTCRPRHIRRFHVPKKGRGTKLFPASDEKHYTPWERT